MYDQIIYHSIPARPLLACPNVAGFLLSVIGRFSVFKISYSLLPLGLKTGGLCIERGQEVQKTLD